MVDFFGTVLGLKDKVVGSFINLFREVSMVRFFPNLFQFIVF